MARKAKDKIEATPVPEGESRGVQSRDGQLEDTLKRLRKDFGEGVITMGSDLIEEKQEVVSTGSPRLDIALGGGVIVGTGMTVAGESGCGKTSTVLKMVANWQKMGRNVVWMAVEPRIYERDLRSIDGLDPERLPIVRSYEGKIYTAQDFLKIAENILSNNTYTMVVIDSISMLCDSSEMEAQGSEGIQPGKLNRLIGSFSRKMGQILPVNKNLLVSIAHVYANFKGHTKWTVAVPAKAQYMRATGIVCEYYEYDTEGKGDKAVRNGQHIHWKVERTLLPGRQPKVTSYLRYGYGIDDIYEVVDMAADIGILRKSGKWIYFGEDEKEDGIEKARAYLAARPDLYKKIKDEVYSRYLMEESDES